MSLTWLQQESRPHTPQTAYSRPGSSPSGPCLTSRKSQPHLLADTLLRDPIKRVPHPHCLGTPHHFHFLLGAHPHVSSPSNGGLAWWVSSAGRAPSFVAGMNEPEWGWQSAGALALPAVC